MKLAAVSIGSVVMGATTYIGNGPELMIKAIAEREQFPTPSFFRYAVFAFAMMLPAHWSRRSSSPASIGDSTSMLITC